MERKFIFQTDTFIDGFMGCFGLYFVLNLMYPKPIAITMEMVQRFHLKIHPDSGTSATSASKGKVLILMKNLTNFFTYSKYKLHLGNKPIHGLGSKR